MSLWQGFCVEQVPHTTFFLTHVCFLFYHVASNITLRRLRHSTADLPDSLKWCFEAAWILALSYFIAYLETIAIANVRCDVYISLIISYKKSSLLGVLSYITNSSYSLLKDYVYLLNHSRILFRN